MSERVVIGSRGSKLALAQAEKVRKLLEEKDFEVEIKVIRTHGDIMKDKPLHEFKGMGAFVRAIDEALKRGEIDLAVHSYKDVPSQRIEGTVIAAVLERESACDAFISREGLKFEEMPIASKIGTSSLRRRAFIKKLRKDLEVENLRGNLDTRLRKLREGLYDGIIVAEAGLIRLGLDREIEYERLSPEVFVPSANQGVIAIASREEDAELFSFLNHEKTRLETDVERAVLRELGIGCAIPAGIYAEAEGKVRLIVEVLSEEGEKSIRVDEKLSKKNAVEEAVEIARNLKSFI
ncbi:hydroxymethylbilane synthase [Ferroglobus sp.]|uniref:hydroxymethylbilane synthase n=1 Tax=Ferroglobus sp. TaxID=2614230 RepID=UPI0025BE1C47|nr:hydroxymethylbilane synthase [Ferroglobus sp.]